MKTPGRCIFRDNHGQKRTKPRYLPRKKKWGKEELVDALEQYLRDTNLLRPTVQSPLGSFTSEGAADKLQTAPSSIRLAMNALLHRGFRFYRFNGVPHDIFRGRHSSGSGWRATHWRYTLPPTPPLCSPP